MKLFTAIQNENWSRKMLDLLEYTYISVMPRMSVFNSLIDFPHPVNKIRGTNFVLPKQTDQFISYVLK